MRVGHLRRCGHRRVGTLCVVRGCLSVGTNGLPAAPVAVFFNTGTTPTCAVTGSVVRLVLYLSRLVSSSPRMDPCLGIMVVRGCGMAGTRGLVPTTGISRRVSLTSGRTSKAKGVGFVLGNTVALKARSKTGMRVRRLMKSSGVCVFKGVPSSVVGLCSRGGRSRGTKCSPGGCCRNSRRVHELISFVEDRRLVRLNSPISLGELFGRLAKGS